MSEDEQFRNAVYEFMGGTNSTLKHLTESFEKLESCQRQDKELLFANIDKQRIIFTRDLNGLREVVDKKIEGNKTNFKLKNNSKTDFEGVTIKLTGIKEMFFELPPIMIGKKSWKGNEEISISSDETSPNIEYQILVEDNNGIEISKKL